jgi:16S rRNA (guanine527-N7)-methyltransferase
VSGSRLRQGLDELGIRSPAAADLLERFLAELDRWNARFGFVKATREELVARHVLDSIAGAATVAALCAEGAPGGVAAAPGGVAAAPGGVAAAPGGVEPRPGGGVLDVGSGAGFPGIPLAIVLPGIRFTLLERSAKKCAFLENCRALLGLANVGVQRADLSAASGGYDVVTFRAVAPLGRFLADLGRSKVAWRSVAAYKGRRDRIDEELAGLGLAARDAEVVRLAAPFMDEERHLVVLRSTRRGAGAGAGSASNLDNPGVGD